MTELDEITQRSLSSTKRELKEHQHLRKREWHQKGYTEDVERRVGKVKETQTREFRKRMFNYSNSCPKLKDTYNFLITYPFFSSPMPLPWFKEWYLMNISVVVF